MQPGVLQHLAVLTTVQNLNMTYWQFRLAQ